MANRKPDSGVEYVPSPERSAEILTYPDPSLVVMAGPSGVGKSTFVERAAPKEGLGTDDIRELLWGTKLDRRGRDVVFDLFHQVIDTRFQEGAGSAVADIVGLKPRDRAPLAEIAKKHGIPAHLILIEGDGEELHGEGKLLTLGLPPEWLDDMLAEQAELIEAIRSGEVAGEGFTSAQILQRSEAAIVRELRFE